MYTLNIYIYSHNYTYIYIFIHDYIYITQYNMYVYIYICPDFGSGTVFIYAIIFFLKHVQYRYSRLAISFPDGRLKPPSKSHQQKTYQLGADMTYIVWHPMIFDCHGYWPFLLPNMDSYNMSIYIYISEAIVKHMLDVLPMSDLHAHCRGRVTGGWSVCPPWRGCHVLRRHLFW